MPKIALHRFVVLALILAWSVTDVAAQRDELFRITRNKDAHEIIYYLNTDEGGRLDKKTPIEAYWIRYDLEEEGRPLSSLERKFAYGLEFSKVTADGATFHFVSFDRTLYLVRTGKQQFEVQVEVEGKRMRLEELFLSLGGGSFWLPKVNYIELRGINERGEAVTDQVVDF